MHTFLFGSTGDDGPMIDMGGAYLVGQDGVPARGEITVADGAIRCQARTADPLGLSVLWPVEGFGTVQLETTRLPPRQAPYHLLLELARHRLMRITLKREEWGLFDYVGMEEIAAEIDRARQAFVRALQHADDTRAAARLAGESLTQAMWASERLSRFHAGVFIARRQSSGGFAKSFLGTAALAQPPQPELLGRIATLFNFVRVPFVWRWVQPAEHDGHYELPDSWVKACTAANLPVRGGPLLHFGVRSVPDWMYLWENDFDTILEMAREHVRHTVERYANRISTWIVASGLHADNVFSLNFEQIMELTRMAATVAKQAAPRAQIVLELTQPWGEYYARNLRTIPPVLYADMCVQSGIPFDAVGLQFVFGIDSDGFHVRDLFQVSAMIDRVANLGKPIHVTAIGAPSRVDQPAESPVTTGGEWHGAWSEETQAGWLAALAEVALSKPYVESVCLNTLADGQGDDVPHSGILHENLAPKQAFDSLLQLHRRLAGDAA